MFGVQRGNTGNTWTRFKHFCQTIKTYGMHENTSPNFFYYKIYDLTRKTIHCKRIWNI